jgi:hypothetical protein
MITEKGIMEKISISVSAETRKHLNIIKTSGELLGVPTHTDKKALKAGIRLLEWYLMRLSNNENIYVLNKETESLQKVDFKW